VTAPENGHAHDPAPAGDPTQWREDSSAPEVEAHGALEHTEDADAMSGAVEQVVTRPLGGAGAPDITTEPVPPIEAVLEAILLVTDEPVPAVTLAQVVERPTEEVEQVLASLAAAYVEQGRGFELRTAAGGWRLYTRTDCAPWVERFVLDGQQARLTQAALETLAVIAYRQPVTRARVSAVRGVNVDGVVRTLVARGLVTEAGPDPESGGTLYVTTGLLLEKLGLDSLEALPSLAPLLPELGDMEEDSTSR
jgi:segregation and condensation protein B